MLRQSHLAGDCFFIEENSLKQSLQTVGRFVNALDAVIARVDNRW